jgi:hypothetical protein
MIEPEKPMLFVTNENTKSNPLGLCQHLKAEHYANKIKSHRSCSSVFTPQNSNPGLGAINYLLPLGLHLVMYLGYHGLSMGDTNSSSPDGQNSVKHV